MIYRYLILFLVFALMSSNFHGQEKSVRGIPALYGRNTHKGMYNMLRLGAAWQPYTAYELGLARTYISLQTKGGGSMAAFSYFLSYEYMPQFRNVTQDHNAIKAGLEVTIFYVMFAMDQKYDLYGANAANLTNFRLGITVFGCFNVTWGRTYQDFDSKKDLPTGLARKNVSIGINYNLRAFKKDRMKQKAVN